MLIEDIKKYDKGIGFQIVIKEFSQKDYKRFMKLIQEGKAIHNSALEEELFKLGGSIPSYKNKVITHEFDILSFSYAYEDNIITINWKQSEESAEDFLKEFEKRSKE